jgi:hypothetical protein
MADKTPEEQTNKTEVKPLLTYVAQHTIWHDGVETKPGETFRHPDEAVIRHLRGNGALLLDTEVRHAEDVAARQAELEAENRKLLAELDSLKAQREAEAKAVREEERTLTLASEVEPGEIVKAKQSGEQRAAAEAVAADKPEKLTKAEKAFLAEADKADKVDNK